MFIKDLFYKPVKVNDKENNIFFWADLHYGHDRDFIYQPRRFSSVIEAQFESIKRWNNTLNQDSVIFYLGDILFGQNGYDRIIDLFDTLTFKTMYLMPGNHHAGWKQLFEDLGEGNFEYRVADNKSVFFVPNYLEAIVNGQPIVLSHYPIVSWNGVGRGSWMIHGHCHGSLLNGELGKLLYKGKIVDVGMENYPKPASFKELKDLFNQKQTVSHDHHNKNTQNPF